MASDDEMRARVVLGARLARAIKLAGLTYGQVAGKTGQDPSNVSSMATGRRPISPRMLELLAQALRVPLADLLATTKGAPMSVPAHRPGTCPVSAGLDWGTGRAVMRLICDLDEGPEHPVAHLDPVAATGGVWFFAGTEWGAARERAWLLAQILERPGPQGG